MSDVAIRVEGVGKQYRLGGAQPRYHTLGDQVRKWVSLRRLLVRRSRDERKPPFWALKDVSFEIQRGEVVGMIGRNGAGKSTLLKVLSRITEPTEGEIDLHGRVGSLLEVGTGFHPELTGRENIFLNGAILGMKRTEIARKFDEIVTFAEVEKFIETPVKHYSSGMYVRLAFAVAAYLEPEILIVDEVLAVGDGQFQKRCLGRIGEVAKGGRTVLFVSHQMASVTRLCNRAILMSGGKIVSDGNVEKVVQQYIAGERANVSHKKWPEGQLPGDDVARMRSVRVRDRSGTTIHVADIRRPIGLEMEYEVLQSGRSLVPNFHLYNADGQCVFVVNDWQHTASRAQAGRYRSTMWIPGNFLSEGTLSVWSVISTLDPVTVHVNEVDAISFEVVDSLDGDSARGPN